MGKKNILIIEDDGFFRELISIKLVANGFEVFGAIDGQDGIDKVKDSKIDLILLDLILPDINGIEVLEEIRKQEETKDIPVFILTNYTSKELERLGYDLKTEQYLTKTDYPPSKLIEVIKERLKEGRIKQ